MIGLSSEKLVRMMIDGLPIKPGSKELMYFQRVAEAIEANNESVEYALKGGNRNDYSA